MKSILNLARFFSTHPLTRDAPLKAWGRFVRWQIASRLREEVIVPWIGGQRLALRRGMSGATGNVYAGLQEFPDMMFALHFLREGDLFLDVGANVGSFTVLASGISKATTWAFEPAPDTARDLKRNIAINGLQNLATVHQLALGSTNGKVPFTMGLGALNVVAEAEGRNARMVEQRTLDSLIGTSMPIMAKLDVEGYEENVLRGAEGVLSMDGLKAIEIETVSPESQRIMQRHGFERAYYDPFRRMLVQEPLNMPSENALFVRDFAFVAHRLETAKPISILGHSL